MHTARPDKVRSGRVRAHAVWRRPPSPHQEGASVRLRIGTGTCGSCPFESWCSAIGAPMPVESSVATPGPAIDSAAGTEPLFVFSGAPVAQRAEPRAWEPRHLEARWPLTCRAIARICKVQVRAAPHSRRTLIFVISLKRTVRKPTSGTLIYSGLLPYQGGKDPNARG